MRIFLRETEWLLPSCVLMISEALAARAQGSPPRRIEQVRIAVEDTKLFAEVRGRDKTAPLRVLQFRARAATRLPV